MKYVIEMERKGAYFKSVTSNVTPLEDFVKPGYDEDKDKIAIDLVATAMGLHSDLKKLFATFNLKFKED